MYCNNKKYTYHSIGVFFICFSIQTISKFTIFSCWTGVSSTFFGILYHLLRQPRQQHAVACCAINTGCPRIGVCLPSFAINDGASLSRTKSHACERTVSIPLFFTYSLSFSFSLKLLLNFDFSTLKVPVQSSA